MAAALLIAGGSQARAQTRALCVHGIASTATLSVRSAPSQTAPATSQLSAGTCGLQQIGRCEGDWCEMALGNIKGWVDTRFVGIYEFPGKAEAFVTPTTPNVGAPATVTSPPGQTKTAVPPLPRRPQTVPPVRAKVSTQEDLVAHATPQRPPRRSVAASAKTPAVVRRPVEGGPAQMQRSPERSGARKIANETAAGRESTYRLSSNGRFDALPRWGRALGPFCLAAGERMTRWMGRLERQGAPRVAGPVPIDGGRCVSRVARWDTLRIRSGPGAGHTEIGSIPPDACRVEAAGRCRGDWCRVAWHGRVGWVNTYYLE